MKKIFILALSIISLSFLGCSTQKAEEDNLTYNNNNIYVSPNNTLDFFYLPLNNDSIYPSPFIVTNNSLIFPNWDDNNKISIIKETLQTNKLNTSIVDTHFDFSTNTMVAIDDTLYFGDSSKGNSLSSINIVDNSYKNLNNHNIKDLILYEENLYYINIQDNNLYCYNTNKETTTKVISNSVGYFVINQGYILYENRSVNSNLYSFNIYSGDNRQLTTFGVNSFGVLNDTIYMINSSDNNNLYTLALLDFEISRKAIINGCNLKVANNKIYYINQDKGNSLFSISPDEKGDSLTYKEEISTGLNEYYPTSKGIFYQSTFNVNNPYIKLKDTK